MAIDVILMIVAIIAVFISSISVFISAKSIKKQEKHNINSVRPICSVYQTNYENFISVRIENDGLGSLIIKNIKCISIDENSVRTEASTLFDLLPKNIQQKDYHRIIPSLSGNFAIAVNEKLFLISVTPKDGETRQIFRETLKKISIHVEYTDIYGNEFTCEQKLCLFDLKSGMPGRYITDVEKYYLWN